MRSHPTLTLLVLLALLLTSTSSGAAGEARPRQLILLPLPIPPGPDEPAMPLRLVAHSLRLPDDRDAQLWRLSWWVRVGDAHRVRVAFDYVGVEGREEARWGGGAARLQWSSRLGKWWGRPVAFDVEGNLPHGDEGLHPFSAKAPLVQLRVRAQWIEWKQWQFTTGWWARRVSPPSASVRQDPLSVFPSGSGYDVVLKRVTAHGDAELVLQRPLGGLPEATWLHTRFDLPLASDLALTLGAMVALAPAEHRPLEHGWTLGLTWRPPPREEPEGERSRGSL